MVPRRPASHRLIPASIRALDVKTASRITFPLAVLFAFTTSLFADLSQSQARTMALISPPARTQSQASRAKRLRAQLARQLRALGIQVVDEHILAANREELHLTPRTVTHRSSIPLLCDRLGMDGVLILGLTRRGRMNRISAFLFDARGSLVVKRHRHQRRAKTPLSWMRSLARAIDSRLRPALPPLEELPELLPENVSLAPLAVESQAPQDLSSGQARSSSWQPAMDLGVDSLGSSNLFADRTQQMDMALHPWLDLGVDISGNWALGYRGEMNTWLRKEDMLQHAHRLYLAKGYAWGSQSQHSLIFLSQVSGNLNRKTYENLDFVQADLQANLDYQLYDWLMVLASAGLGGRGFIHDTQSSSLDTQTALGLEFRMPANWRVGISGHADARVYVRSDVGAKDANDVQFSGRLSLNGPLWKKAKLSLQVGYRKAVGDSHQVQRILAEAQIRALGDTYLSSGPRAGLGLVQLLGQGSRISARLNFEQNEYAGWPALDAQGANMGKTRFDRRLGPALAFAHNWFSEQDQAGAASFDYSLRAEYGYVRQWSNGPWTDVDIHLLSLNLRGAF